MQTAPQTGRDKLTRQMPLTNRAIARVKWRQHRFIVNDRDGLRLAFYPAGRRTWQLRTVILGRPALLTVGYWPELSLRAARERAALLEAAIERGEDPRVAADSGERVTVAAFARRWLREVVSKARKNPEPIEKRLARHILPRLGQQTLARVTMADVRGLVFAERDAGRAASAVAIRDILWRIFDYARICGLVTGNPAEALERKFIARLRSRTRSLSTAELKQFYQGLRSERLGARAAIALELLLLTLARKSELLQAQWKHIDLAAGTWEVPAESSKSGQAHVVYLSGRAVALLSCLLDSARAADHYVLTARNSGTQPMAPNLLNKAIERVNWGMPHFTPHDLRRTASTHLNEKGYSADWIEKALNHAVRGGVRGVYNRAQYAPERKRMLEEWAEWLEGLKDGWGLRSRKPRFLPRVHAQDNGAGARED